MTRAKPRGDVPIDAFNAAHHRAQRRLRLAIHILENSGEDIMGNPTLGEPGFVSALSELLIDAADDLVTADETVQRAWRREAVRR